MASPSFENLGNSFTPVAVNLLIKSVYVEIRCKLKVFLEKAFELSLAL